VFVKYDYLIVGAGWFGAVVARELADAGKRCLVIDRYRHIAGHSYTEEREGIQVHKYGPHIFHTGSERIWSYVKRFADFNDFINRPIAHYRDETYSLPFNMWTYQQLWGVTTPEEAMQKMARQTGGGRPANLEQQALALVGRTLYEKLIKGYTEKQWMMPAESLPAAIISRIPVRFTFNDNYYNDRYQGIPVGGYTRLFEKLLDGIEVRLGTDYLDDRAHWNATATRIIYSGAIDRFFDYAHGALDYRTLRFEESVIETADYQGRAVINYTDRETPWTRIVEHKHFEFGKQEVTVITKEFPEAWETGSTPYYPVNNAVNNRLYNLYRESALQEKNVIFGGRLGKYRYYDMDQVVAAALKTARREIGDAHG